MNKWMLITAITCSVNINAMEQKDRPEEPGIMELQCALAWLNEDDHHKWRSNAEVKEYSKTHVAESLAYAPNRSSCMGVLNVLRTYAFLPDEKRTCRDPNFAARINWVDDAAGTINDNVLRSLFNDPKTEQYFNDICSGKKK
jgi:hypothetical protein